MESKVTIKNFRAFDEDGVMVDLKPITILTGCNSAGKSSMTKAVSLLYSFLSQIKKAQDNGEKIDLTKYRLDFRRKPNNLLGNFNNVIHKGSSNQKITFEYTVYSRMLSKDVTVQLVFAANENDGLHNGWLERVTMSTDEGQFFSTDAENGSVFNYNIIKESAYNFLEVEYLCDYFCEAINADPWELSYKEVEKRKKETNSNLQKYDDKIVEDVVDYVSTSANKNSIVKRCKANPDIISWSKENGSLFYIPVIDDLNKLDKSEIKEWINKNITKDDFYSDWDRVYSNKTIDDYVASGYSCFSDFFKSCEVEELNKISNNTLTLKKFKIEPLKFEGFDEEKARTEKIPFEVLYDVVMHWNLKLHRAQTEYYNGWGEYVYEYGTDNHHMFSLIRRFATDVVKDALLPDWSGNMEYVSSSRAKINRLYTLDATDDFTELIMRYFDSKRENASVTEKDYSPNGFINKWIKEFEVGYGITLSTTLSPTDDDTALGVFIRLQKSPDDEKGQLLADEGYGITQLVSILLQIETAILSAKGEKINQHFHLTLDSKEAAKFHYETNTILIEEPEIHLHPKYQSLLADMLVDAYQNYNIHFIVETHSEYLIRRLQLLVAGIDTDVKLDNDDISILYIYSKEEAEKEHQPIVKKIAICEDGYLDDTFGGGFFDEATNLSRKLM